MNKQTNLNRQTYSSNQNINYDGILHFPSICSAASMSPHPLLSLYSSGGRDNKSLLKNADLPFGSHQALDD